MHAKSRRYAVALVRGTEVTHLLHTRMTLVEADRFARRFSRCCPNFDGQERCTAILRHPISRAIRKANSRSRSA